MKKSNKIFTINIFLTIAFLIGLHFFDKNIGGNATNGKIENDIYYVKDALGNFNAVSRFLYSVNYVYTCLTVLLIVISAISIAILQYRFINYCKQTKGKIDNLI